MTEYYEMPSPFADVCPHSGVGKACKPCREKHAAEALRDVLAVSREDVARALHADDLAHERAASEWLDVNPVTRAWYLDQADAALAIIRRAITAHIDPADPRGPRA